MKISAVFCLVLVACVCVYAEEVDFKAQKEEIKKACLEEHKISTEELENIQSKDFTTTDNEEAKCFIKCFMNKSGVVSDKGVDVEKVVAYAEYKKEDVVAARENAEKCKELFKENDCATSLALLTCMKKK